MLNLSNHKAVFINQQPYEGWDNLHPCSSDIECRIQIWWICLFYSLLHQCYSLLHQCKDSLEFFTRKTHFQTQPTSCHPFATWTTTAAPGNLHPLQQAQPTPIFLNRYIKACKKRVIYGSEYWHGDIWTLAYMCSHVLKEPTVLFKILLPSHITSKEAG